MPKTREVKNTIQTDANTRETTRARLHRLWVFSRFVFLFPPRVFRSAWVLPRPRSSSPPGPHLGCLPRVFADVPAPSCSSKLVPDFAPAQAPGGSPNASGGQVSFHVWGSRRSSLDRQQCRADATRVDRDRGAETMMHRRGEEQ